MSTYEKWLLWISTAVVALSGTVLGWMKYFLSSADPYAVVHHPWQPYFLKAHVLSAPFLVFALGVVFTRHVLRHWAAGAEPGRRSGIGIVGTIVPMVVSGYLLQTLTSESWLFRIAMLHVAAALLYLAGLGVHQFFAWRAARRRDAGARFSRPLSSRSL